MIVDSPTVSPLHTGAWCINCDTAILIKDEKKTPTDDNTLHPDHTSQYSRSPLISMDTRSLLPEAPTFTHGQQLPHKVSGLASRPNSTLQPSVIKLPSISVNSHLVAH